MVYQETIEKASCVHCGNSLGATLQLLREKERRRKELQYRYKGEDKKRIKAEKKEKSFWERWKCALLLVPSWFYIVMGALFVLLVGVPVALGVTGSGLAGLVGGIIMGQVLSEVHDRLDVDLKREVKQERRQWIEAQLKNEGYP